ncbi:MAG TPA: MmcQ/YjbR family DNA-binding protein, partial [Ferruginibacter sp.]|nr:MmcQ/YjbR family DNA-binding protein [Ferruginibacter sp.]
RSYALQFDDVTEGFPFGEDTLVYKVDNKIFLLLALDEAALSMNVKCDPEKALELREEYPDQILPGYHMNKKHWNTIIVGGLKTTLIKQMIEDSYNLVAKKKK